MERWSVKYHWIERARAWDADEHVRRRELFRDERDTELREQIRMLQGVRAPVEWWLKAATPETLGNLKLSEVVAILKLTGPELRELYGVVGTDTEEPEVGALPPPLAERQATVLDPRRARAVLELVKLDAEARSNGNGNGDGHSR